MPESRLFNQLPLRRVFVASAILLVLLLICLTYSANSFIAGVSLAGTFGAAPWSPIDAYVGAIGFTCPKSFWQRFLVVESVDYVSDYYRGTEACIAEGHSHIGIGVVEASRMDEYAQDVTFSPAVGHRLTRPEVLVRIDRYKSYEGPIPSEDRDQARVTVRFRFLWTHFMVKAGY